jgi:tetratricopeptide (TPR) repeat protein
MRMLVEASFLVHGLMATVELSMIVKNGAAGLGRCLKSVQGLVDRIVIGDTGSTDETLAIAAEYGAEIVTVPWNNDFARARNYVLAQAKSDWVLVLDADEMLDASARNLIPRLIEDPTVAGYDIVGWNYVGDAGYRSSGEQAVVNEGKLPEAASYPAYFRTLHTRLFRCDPRIRFEHCVHESVCDSMETSQLTRRPAAFILHHFGVVEDIDEQRKAKGSLYYSLALEKAATSKRSYRANLDAGMSEFDYAKRPLAALPYFKTAMMLAPKQPAAWLYGGMCLTRLGRHAEALKYLKRAAALDGRNMLIPSSLGDVFFQTGDYPKALEEYRRAVKLGDASALTKAKLGATEVHLGQTVEGLQRVEQAVKQSPDSSELYDIWSTTALLAGQHDAAREASDRRLNMQNVAGFHFYLAATIHLHTNHRPKAETILISGARKFPNDADIQTMMKSLNLVA